MAKMPTAPGWYRAGYDHLRYFNGNEWTENTRPLPDFSPILDSSGYYTPEAEMGMRLKHLRKYFALTLLLILILGFLAQAIGI